MDFVLCELRKLIRSRLRSSGTGVRLRARLQCCPTEVRRQEALRSLPAVRSAPWAHHIGRAAPAEETVARLARARFAVGRFCAITVRSDVTIRRSERQAFPAFPHRMPRDQDGSRDPPNHDNRMAPIPPRQSRDPLTSTRSTASTYHATASISRIVSPAIPDRKSVV